MRGAETPNILLTVTWKQSQGDQTDGFISKILICSTGLCLDWPCTQTGDGEPRVGKEVKDLSWACLSNTALLLWCNYESSCFPGLDEISPKTTPLSKLLFHIHQVIFWLFYFPGTSLSEKTMLWIRVIGIQERIHQRNVL